MKKNGKFLLFFLDEFDQWLQDTRFNRVVTLIQRHHTYIPGYSHYKGNNHFALLRTWSRARKERGFDHRPEPHHVPRRDRCRMSFVRVHPGRHKGGEYLRDLHRKHR